MTALFFSCSCFDRLKEQFNYAPLVMVGDGATDIQAKPPADLTVGFGGIVEREAVRKNADVFVWDFKQLTEALRS